MDDSESTSRMAEPAETRLSIEPGRSTEDSSLSEARRKAGAEDLERAIQATTSKSGGDPFAVRGKDKKSGTGGKGRRRRDPAEDPDVKAFGQLFDSSKVYIYMSAFSICKALSPVLIKGSLYSMQTPAVLLFLHMLATIIFLWIASQYDVFELNQLTLQGVKGAVVSATLWSLQTLCVFSALHHNSVILVLTWTLLGRQLVYSAVKAAGSHQPLPKDLSMLLMIGSGAAVFELILDSDKVWVGFLVLSLWTLLTAAEAGWTHLKSDPSLGGKLANYKLVGLVRELSDEEDALTGPNKAFLQHALPAVPVLLLGFTALEGRELVNHELSVPAVTLMLLACASYAAAVGCELLLEGKVQGQTGTGLQAAATLGSIVLYFMEEIRTISWAAVLCCTVACCASYMTTFVQKS